LEGIREIRLSSGPPKRRGGTRKKMVHGVNPSHGLKARGNDPCALRAKGRGEGEGRDGSECEKEVSEREREREREGVGPLRAAPTKEAHSGPFGPRALVVPSALPCPGLCLWRPVGPHERGGNDRRERVIEAHRMGFRWRCWRRWRRWWRWWRWRCWEWISRGCARGFAPQ
jgi:hypothetical protein